MERSTMNPASGRDAALEQSADAISLHRLVRTQGSFTLGPLDMHVPTGLVTGFVGPNGAGKTTAIKAMLGMIHTDSGSLRVLRDAPGAHHERIGVVLDALTLPSDWTAKSAARALSRFYPVWDSALFNSLLQRMQVPASTKASRLSRGEGVKLQLALALAHRPELLILDEPTSGLDPVARLEVLDVFREFLVDEGRTILFSTHITSDLERIADHLHVIAKGRTLFAGPLDALEEEYAMARGPLAALDADSRHALIGVRERADSFEGLVASHDTALFGPQVLIERPGLDEAIACLVRGSGEELTSADEPVGRKEH